MEAPTCLTDPAALVVIDTSAAINLSSTGCAAEILRALPNRALAVDVIQIELERGRQSGRKDADLFAELAAENLIEIVTLDVATEDLFENLVVGSAATTLDDGEAATIAYAAVRGATAIVDERKAIRIGLERFPKLQFGSTVDLFAHPEVLRVLGRNRLSQVLVNALQLARMRVLPHHLDWVVELIGSEQARLCASLPRSVRNILASTDIEVTKRSRAQ